MFLPLFVSLFAALFGTITQSHPLQELVSIIWFFYFTFPAGAFLLCVCAVFNYLKKGKQ